MERALYLSEREEEMKQYTKQLFPFLFSVQIGGRPSVTCCLLTRDPGEKRRPLTVAFIEPRDETERHHVREDVNED